MRFDNAPFSWCFCFQIWLEICGTKSVITLVQLSFFCQRKFRELRTFCLSLLLPLCIGDHHDQTIAFQDNFDGASQAFFFGRRFATGRRPMRRTVQLPFYGEMIISSGSESGSLYNNNNNNDNEEVKSIFVRDCQTIGALLYTWDGEKSWTGW